MRERIDKNGGVKVPLDWSSLARAINTFRASDVESIAVCLLWAHVNPVHEQQIKEHLAEELPGVPVMLSSEVLPEIGEWVRTSSTVLSAYVFPRTNTYLRELESWLATNGLRTSLQIMQLNGGCAAVDHVLRAPVSIVHSGPAAAPAASRWIVEQIGLEDAMTIDMGGTSFEAGIIRRGEIPLSRDEMIAHQPIGLPAVEIASIGAGGGSIAWVDNGGALRVGPQSAGSMPGPAAYARGGRFPTVTDANIVLGYLSPETFLGGRRPLRPDLALKAIEEHVAGPLGISDPHEAAAGILRVVNDNMVNAIRAVTVERGIDPRGFVMVTGGGGGALHGARMADALEIASIVVPFQSGLLSAFGMTVSDVRHDYSATLYAQTSDMPWDELNAIYRKLEADAEEDLRLAGFRADSSEIARTVDARYAGQVHELIVPVPAGVLDQTSLEDMRRFFDDAHRERFSYDLPEAPIEFLHWRATGIGVRPRPASANARVESARDDAGSEVPHGVRRAYFEEAGGFVEVPALNALILEDGAVVAGPALLDSPTTTVLVPPGYRATAEPGGFRLVRSDAVEHPESIEIREAN